LGWVKDFGITWDIGIFFIHSAYGIDVKFIATLDSTMSTKERDTDGSYAFFVHAEPVLGHFTGVPQDEILKGNLGKATIELSVWAAPSGV
jgi:hypothetical protein